MWLILTVYIIFFIPCISLAANDINKQTILLSNGQIRQCQTIGDKCQETSDCCSDFICYSVDAEKNICLSPKHAERSKHNVDDFFIPPYYNPHKQLYPYGISKPALPFYKIETSKQTFERKKQDWDHCQFHEDCGEGNCCYVHFRFRSMPKWFCRSNRNEATSLCEPLTKYRSLKDVPAWKQLQQQQQQKEQHAIETKYDDE